MKISDFKYSKTPIIQCTFDGRVINKNLSAQKNLRNDGERKKVIINGRYAEYGVYHGFCCEDEEGVWAIFPGFAQFSFEGKAFHSAEDAISISCKQMLELESRLSSLGGSRGDVGKLWRVRKIMYEKYAIVLNRYVVPMFLYAADNFIDYFSRACELFYSQFGADVRVYAPHEKRSMIINIRNVTIIITQICTGLLSQIRCQRLNIMFSYSGDYLCAEIKGLTDVIPFLCENERDIMRLTEYMNEYTIGIVALDVAMQTCGYYVEYDINNNGKYSVRIYFKAEKNIQCLRDKGSEDDLANQCPKVHMLG